MTGKSNVIPFRTRKAEKLQLLDIPVPPTLEEVICYTGSERYVALWWTRCGEDIVYDDGYRSGTGYSYGWLAFARHPAVSPILSRLDYVDYDCGDRVSTERLLLDRYQRCFTYGQSSLVMETMRRENNVPVHDGPPLEMSKEQLDAIAAAFRDNQAVSIQELERRIAGHHRQIKQMLVWLDIAASQ